jgi:hypothetical protein
VIIFRDSDLISLFCKRTAKVTAQTSFVSFFGWSVDKVVAATVLSDQSNRDSAKKTEPQLDSEDQPFDFTRLFVTSNCP